MQLNDETIRELIEIPTQLRKQMLAFPHDIERPHPLLPSRATVFRAATAARLRANICIASSRAAIVKGVRGSHAKRDCRTLAKPVFAAAAAMARPRNTITRPSLRVRPNCVASRSCKNRAQNNRAHPRWSSGGQEAEWQEDGPADHDAASSSALSAS